MALLTNNFNQVARKRNKRLEGTYQPKNMNFASNPSIVPFKVNRVFEVNTKLTNKIKGIQCMNVRGMVISRQNVLTPVRKKVLHGDLE